MKGDLKNPIILTYPDIGLDRKCAFLISSISCFVEAGSYWKLATRTTPLTILLDAACFNSFFKFAMDRLPYLEKFCIVNVDPPGQYCGAR